MTHPMWPFGLYSPGMHDFVLREMELGKRVAACQDAEDCGFGALFDLDYAEYIRAHEDRHA